MSAELLRRAAKEMRERAEAAASGPWRSEYGSVRGALDDPAKAMTGYGSETDTVLIVQRPNHRHRSDEQKRANAEHIASWHPAVALAVADLLDAAADAEPIDFDEPPRNPRDLRLIYAALAAARTYLGEETI
jgi:hypothetical protein